MSPEILAAGTSEFPIQFQSLAYIVEVAATA